MARVYIGNLDPHVPQEELDAECRRFGNLTSVWVARNPPGFAFVVSPSALYASFPPCHVELVLAALTEASSPPPVIGI